ncbi:flocculation protein FLO11-like [Humulus lupulus]|uniref:flocculation protein FLO11-like n=1 Tax=Humulus lupulus TaxID=3486 RepID=UPI002B40F669|nr:flocculation protein FLO11-like [Humulus lupulus]
MGVEDEYAAEAFNSTSNGANFEDYMLFSPTITSPLHPSLPLSVIRSLLLSTTDSYFTTSYEEYFKITSGDDQLQKPAKPMPLMYPQSNTSSGSPNATNNCSSSDPSLNIYGTNNSDSTVDHHGQSFPGGNDQQSHLTKTLYPSPSPTTTTTTCSNGSSPNPSPSSAKSSSDAPPNLNLGGTIQSSNTTTNSKSSQSSTSTSNNNCSSPDPTTTFSADSQTSSTSDQRCRVSFPFEMDQSLYMSIISRYFSYMLVHADILQIGVPATANSRQSLPLSPPQSNTSNSSPSARNYCSSSDPSLDIDTNNSDSTVEHGQTFPGNNDQSGVYSSRFGDENYVLFPQPHTNGSTDDHYSHRNINLSSARSSSDPPSRLNLGGTSSLQFGVPEDSRQRRENNSTDLPSESDDLPQPPNGQSHNFSTASNVVVEDNSSSETPIFQLDDHATFPPLPPPGSS